MTFAGSEATGACAASAIFSMDEISAAGHAVARDVTDEGAQPLVIHHDEVVKVPGDLGHWNIARCDVEPATLASHAAE